MNIQCRIVIILCISTCCMLLSLTPIWAAEKSDHIVITSAEIEKMNVRSMPDLLNQVPGVKADESSVTIQGSSKVKVLVDNRPINDPASGTGVKWNQVSAASVDQIAIYKGGGSVEYGEDSGGGVILITTKQSNKFQLNFEAYGGDFNTRSFSADSQASTDSINFGTSLGFEGTEGFRANDDREKIRAGFKLDYNSHSSLKLQPSISYYRESKGMAGFPGYETPRYRDDYDNCSMTLITTLRNIRSKSYYNDVTGEVENPDQLFSFGIDVNKFGQELITPINLNRLGKASIGAGLEYSEVDWNRIIGSSVVPYEEDIAFGKESEEKVFMFATHQIAFNNSPVSLYSGLRGVYYSEFQNAVNPEVRISYSKERWSFQAGFSMADNIPTFLQRYKETTATRPNPDLEIEKAENYNITLFSQIHKKASVNISFFYNKVANRITYYRREDGYRSYENVGVAIMQGTETSVNWKPIESFSFNISYAYLNAKDADTDKYLPGKPKHKGQIDFLIAPVDKFSVAITSAYTSEQYLDSNNEHSLTDYYLTNCRVEYKLSKFDVFGEVKNLFDEEYFYWYGYPAPPMTWIVGLHFPFF